MITDTELTVENVWNLSEAEAFELNNRIESNNKATDKNNAALAIINSAFQFRNVPRKKRSQQQDLKMFGFKFFQKEGNTEELFGVCKRKYPNKNVI